MSAVTNFPNPDGSVTPSSLPPIPYAELQAEGELDRASLGDPSIPFVLANCARNLILDANLQAADQSVLIPNRVVWVNGDILSAADFPPNWGDDPRWAVVVPVVVPPTPKVPPPPAVVVPDAVHPIDALPPHTVIETLPGGQFTVKKQGEAPVTHTNGFESWLHTEFGWVGRIFSHIKL